MRDRHVDKMEKESSFRWVGLQMQECNVCERACVCVCVCVSVRVCGLPDGQTANILRTGRPFTSRGHSRKKKKRKRKFLGEVVGNTHFLCHTHTHTCTRLTFPTLNIFTVKGLFVLLLPESNCRRARCGTVNKTMMSLNCQVEVLRINNGALARRCEQMYSTASESL